MASNGISQAHGTNAGFCLCGCGQTTSVKANYRAGHDASHVSNLLAELIRTQGASYSGEMVRQMSQYLPTEALRIKFTNAANRYADRKATAKPRQGTYEWVDCDTDTYRKGRWDYPVQVKMRRDQSDSDYYGFRANTKRDGSGEWFEVDADELTGR